MPIRFRCVYCNQLLGISRRKAGTIVRCTTCQGQLIVPDPDDGTTEPAPEGPVLNRPTVAQEEKTAAKPDLFEQGDFDDLLQPNSGGSSPAAVAAPPKPSSARRKADAPSPAPAVTLAPPAGLVLTRRQLTLLTGLLILGLGLAFAGGLLLGLSLRGG
jgi:hypothetical protein